MHVLKRLKRMQDKFLIVFIMLFFIGNQYMISNEIEDNISIELDYEIMNDDEVIFRFEFDTEEDIEIPVSDFMIVTSTRHSGMTPGNRYLQTFFLITPCSVDYNSFPAANMGDYYTKYLPRKISLGPRLNFETNTLEFQIHKKGLGKFIDTADACTKLYVEFPYSDTYDYGVFYSYILDQLSKKTFNEMKDTKYIQEKIIIKLDSLVEDGYQEYDKINYEMSKAEVALIKAVFNQHITREFILKKKNNSE